MVLEKGATTRYPVPYTVWRREKGARFTYDSTLEEVVAATRRSEFAAAPVEAEDPTSSWLTARAKAIRALRNVLGKSAYQARAGSYTGGANAVYWVEVLRKRPDGVVVVRNITEGAKVKVEEVNRPLELDLLYPLLRGRDADRWKAAPSAQILVAHEPGKRLTAIPEKEMQTRYPLTFAYLKSFEKTLRDRKSRGVSDMLGKGAPFYTMFALGDYTFAPWKVVWREVSHRLDAAVIGTPGTKVTIPDHTLIMIECDGKVEAHYLCAALNSSPSRHVVQSYIVLHPDPHIMERVCIPKYEPKDNVHKRLAELSMQAHEAAKTGDEKAVAEIESQVDLESAKLWNLTPSDLAEIQRSLKELTE
jgi:hypothetical protein